MRKWANVAAVAVAVAVAVVCPTTALAEGPPEVYGDFAEDGVLSCGHSRAALKDTLNDASIHQYGDPWTSIGLKLAIRKQLAGGCRSRSERSSSLFAVGADSGPGATESSPSSTPPSPDKSATRPVDTERDPVTPPATAGISTASDRDGRMVLLGVVLLLLTLGSGGWAARRAFTDKR
jgi:hypothetical protein